MMTVTIDPKTWIRGNANNSYLLRSADRHMCCMGFFALACGFTEYEIEGFFTLAGIAGLGTWHGLPENLKELWRHEHRGHQELSEIYRLNDMGGLDDAERIRRLNVVLAPYDVTLELKQGTDVVG